MVFSSALFVFKFFPITIAIYYLISDKYKNAWLFFASLFFYAWGEPKYIILMLISIVLNYFFGITIETAEKKTMQKTLFITACVIDVGILFIFKYLNFFADNITVLLKINNPLPPIALPIGISFYTFQILSYIIDVYKREIKAQRNLMNLGLYIALFPQLIAGPIVRYQDINSEIASRLFCWDDFYSGIKRFMLGFSKKVIIADNVAVLADRAFSSISLNAPMAWLGMIAYTLQIYFDFSGYSDMAIGIGRIFGFHFNENFNYPYISKSVKEFWRRWHISLSSWFRDYVYIPLGGSRQGEAKTNMNLFIVFLLTGIWHGASWNFVCWGLYYVVFQILEKYFLSGILQKTPKVFRHIYALLVIMFGWVLFRADTLTAAVKYLKALFHFSPMEFGDIVFIQSSREQILLIIIGMICSAPCVYKLLQTIECKTKWADGIYIIIFLIAIMYMSGRNFSPFLYFRF